MDTTTEAE